MKLPAARSAIGIAAIPAQRAKGAPAAPSAPAAATPSSLIKVPDSARARCVACGSPKLTQIAMTLTDGTPVQFTSCRHCEHRRWTHDTSAGVGGSGTGGSGDGHVLPVDSVLSKATKRS
jgi:hypothetical protein